MSRFVLALRCFFAVLFRYRLPADAVALLPPPDLGPPLHTETPARQEPHPGPLVRPESSVTSSDKAASLPPAGALSEARLHQDPAHPPRPLPLIDEAELRRRGAIQMLTVLQREGRLVDFLMEDVSAYDDAQIGAAVRDIHRGCRKGLVEHLKLSPLRPEPDEAAVRIEQGYDPSKVRLIGNITGRPPFHGTLRHHGWAAQSVTLPDLPANHDPLVITPAEVELGG